VSGGNMMMGAEAETEEVTEFGNRPVSPAWKQVLAGL
jgi:hypothetical protein